MKSSHCTRDFMSIGSHTYLTLKETCSFYCASNLPSLQPLCSKWYFCQSLKEAMVYLCIKKPNINLEQLKSYRPISNLSCISKIVERVSQMFHSPCQRIHQKSASTSNQGNQLDFFDLMTSARMGPLRYPWPEANRCCP